MGFGGLYISISGLQANKRSLETISHNISNSNNSNYVRQGAMHVSNSYTTSMDNRFQLGTGVSVQQIRQIRDEFLDIKFRREMATFGYHKAKSELLADVESIFNEIPDSGLQKIMDGFWDKWNELYKEADSLPIRGLVHESAIAFTDTVNHMSTQLDNIQQNLNKKIVTTVNDINNTLEKIANLNKKIKVIEGSNNLMKANDYRDERNALLDKLSGILPISCYENNLGEAIVSLQGKDLVSGSNSNTISIENDEKGLANIYWKDSKEKIELNKSGELGGLIDVRDGSVKEYINRLDVLVKTIATEINNIHRTGLDLQGNTNIDFFVPADGSINASNIRVNPILSDFNKIAASKTLDKGDGDIAKAIHELRKQALYGKFNPSKPFDDPANKDMNIDEFYNDLIAVLGIERESSRGTAETQAFLINQINEDRKGISSVSLDEEMTDMIKYQHSYIANSRVINAVDEMIENVVNRLGLVGR